jgi:lipopolysaccharide transport system permease protein
MAEVNIPNYEVVIEPARGRWRIDWRELWEYRDLLVQFVRRDFVARYKQTLLGPVWFIFQPLLTTLVFVVIFHRMAGIPTGGVPAPLFYLTGLLGWNYFAQNLSTAGSTFVTNSGMFSKVYFPRLIAPLSVVVSNLVGLALQAIPLLGFYFWFACTGTLGAVANPGWRLFLVVPIILHIGLLSLGFSLWMAAGTARYRDLTHLNAFLVQLWLFATPIFYPLATAGGRWRSLLLLNPVSAPIEALRLCLLGNGGLAPGELAGSLAVTAVLLVTGIAVFQRVSRSAVDTL